LIDQEKATKDFLLSSYPQTKGKSEEYIKKAEPLQENNFLDVIGMKNKGGLVEPSKTA
ncbi:unnamed protein product, partial [marine sediment metagenome]